MTAAAFQWRVVLGEHAIDEYCDVAGIKFLAVFENGAAEDDVVSLPCTSSTQWIDQRRIDAVDGRGKAIWVGGVVVVIEHLNLDLAHEKNTAVAAPLTVALDFARRAPLDVKLAIGEFFFRADVATARHALEDTVFDFPFGRLGGLLVRLPFLKFIRVSAKENRGI